MVYVFGKQSNSGNVAVHNGEYRLIAGYVNENLGPKPATDARESHRPGHPSGSRRAMSVAARLVHACPPDKGIDTCRECHPPVGKLNHHRVTPPIGSAR